MKGNRKGMVRMMEKENGRERKMGKNETEKWL